MRNMAGPTMTRLGPDWRHTRYRNPKPQYFVYQVCGWLLGVSYGTSGAKSYKFEDGRLIIYDESGAEVLNDSVASLRSMLRKVKWPNYPWS